MGSSWHFSGPSHHAMARDIYLPAQTEVLRNLQKGLWGEDPRHHLPRYLCDTGQLYLCTCHCTSVIQEYFIIEKRNSFPGSQAGCQRLQVKSSCLTPFGTEP